MIQLKLGGYEGPSLSQRVGFLRRGKRGRRAEKEFPAGGGLQEGQVQSLKGLRGWRGQGAAVR